LCPTTTSSLSVACFFSSTTAISFTRFSCSSATYMCVRDCHVQMSCLTIRTIWYLLIRWIDLSIQRPCREHVNILSYNIRDHAGI
jgi:hypothetical protein